MKQSPLTGVLFGHGHMGKLHAERILQRSGVQLEIVDPAQGLGAAAAHTPDFAIIATPTRVHAEVALPLLERGVPCLVEKPLAATLSQAEQLAKYSHLSVGHIERFNPVFSAIKDARAEFIEVERLAPSTGRSSDIDVIGDLMIHDLDLLLQVMRGPILDVRAKGVSVAGALPDMVNARIEIDLGPNRVGVANLTASRVSNQTVRTWRVFEPGRYWSLDLHKRQAKTQTWPGEPEGLLSLGDSDPLTAEHEAFLAAVRGDGPFVCTGTEALAALALAERIRQCLH